MLPKYACVILRDAQGRLLLEQRPPTVRFAAGWLTCYGGKRESPESAEWCARRELAEELDMQLPLPMATAVDLYVAGKFTARFFEAQLPADEPVLRSEPGRVLCRLAPDELPKAPISRWHAAVLKAWLAGQQRVDLAG